MREAAQGLLTRREVQIATLVGVKCMTSKEAAREAGVSYRTIEVFRANILAKLGLRNVAELARHLALHPFGEPVTVPAASRARRSAA
jgi:DNA-binding NarL/FixJ family response regulator